MLFSNLNVMCAHFINTFLVDHSADAFKLSYSALSSEFSVSLRFTAFFFQQISSRKCPAFEDPLADAPPCPKLYKVKNISLPVETLRTKFCFEGFADS
jgi:hypothetical protein